MGSFFTTARVPVRDVSSHAVATATLSGSNQGREFACAREEYRDLRYHAGGALGEVFTAKNAELNREVALKFLKPSRACDPESRRRFFLEAEVTSRLEHPGVVPIYALGTDNAGAPCYAMRFIRGETLQDRIAAFHTTDQPAATRRSSHSLYANCCTGSSRSATRRPTPTTAASFTAT